jgi:hypothetical protein
MLEIVDFAAISAPLTLDTAGIMLAFAKIVSENCGQIHRHAASNSASAASLIASIIASSS